MNTAGVESGAGWYDQAAPAGYGAPWPDGNGYAASGDYGLPGAEPAWVAALIGGSSQGWQDAQDWAAEPVLPADHPSAPVPRVRFPEEQPAWTTWTPRPPTSPGPDSAGSRPPFVGGQDLPRRRPAARKADGSGYRQTAARPPRDPLQVRRPGRHAAAAGADHVHWEVQRKPGPGVGEVAGFQRPAGPVRPETADYRRDAGPSGPGPRRPTAFQNSRPPGSDSLYRAGQVLTLADGQAARIAEEAQASAAAIRAAAEREAAAIREGAQQEAAELRARLDSLLGDLGRVVAAYIAESLASPASSATATAMPAVSPTLPGARPAPRTRPATKPARPESEPGTRPAEQARPRTAPGTKPQKRPRQHQAMRVASCATAGLVLLTLIGGATEIGLHGLKFFVFREAGIGQTAGSETDQQFLAREAASHHTVAPKGRHHKRPHQPVEAQNK